MFHKSLTLLVSISLLASTALTMDQDNKSKQSVSSRTTKQPKNTRTLTERIESNKKLLDQIKKLTERMDADAAANMFIQGFQKIFNSSFNQIIDELISTMFDKFTHTAEQTSEPQAEELVRSLINQVLSKTSKTISNLIADSVSIDIALSAISPEARTTAMETFFTTYMQNTLTIAKSFKDIQVTVNPIPNIQEIKDLILPPLKTIIDESIQAMANVLAKHYEIDFESLGLKQPIEQETAVAEIK